MNSPEFAVPGDMIPNYRVDRALKAGTARKFLFKTWGGLGDVACAEPTIRFALDKFDECEISLATYTPELFEHLRPRLKEFFDLRTTLHIDYDQYLVFETIKTPADLSWQFFSHLITHCVDYVSLCCLRMQLPIQYRQITLKPTQPIDVVPLEYDDLVFIHAGKHWPSKTFPAAWWEAFTEAIVDEGFTPVLIGKTVDKNVGYVDFKFDETYVIDARNQWSLSAMIFHLLRARRLFANDSSPIHIASAGGAHIGFVSSCKHADYIKHWREDVYGDMQFGFRMKDFARDNLFNHTDFNPAQVASTTVEFMDKYTMAKILPEPRQCAKDYIEWTSV